MSGLSNFWSDAAALLAAGAIVAAFALPVGAIAWLIVRRRASPLFLPWRPWRAPWGVFEVVLTVIAIELVIPPIVVLLFSSTDTFKTPSGANLPAEDASAAVAGMPAAVSRRLQQEELDKTLRGLWTGVLSFPLQFSLLVGASRILYPSWWRNPQPTLASRLVVAIAGWLILAPVVLAINSAVNVVFALLQWQIETHRLARLAGRPALDSALLVIQACIAAPVVEEALFRGVILCWALGGRKPLPAPDIPARLRPWLILAFVLAIGCLSAIDFQDKAIVFTGRYGPPLFALILVLGLAVLQRLVPGKCRTLGAVYSSAALFGMVHVSYWPNPIALFLLGLGLGWLAVRTRGLVVPIIVHGLFNAVAAVVVLRSASG